MFQALMNKHLAASTDTQGVSRPQTDCSILSPMERSCDTSRKCLDRCSAGV